MKEQIRDLINTYSKFNKQKILAKIKDADIVSFDIFDTLVKRDVHRPHDVFDLVEKQVSSRIGKQISGFRKLRTNSESECREHLADGSEITLDNIYDCIQRKEITIGGVTTEISLDLAEQLKCTEIECEIAVCNPDPSMKEIYNVCIKNGKRVYIISDMYLSAAVIGKILSKCEYKGYSALFVSSDEQKTKSSGSLFDYIKQKEHIEGENWIHIGDSLKGDVISPRKHGIRSLKIPRYKNSLQYLNKVDNQSFDYVQLRTFINGRLATVSDDIEKLGYEIYGPILYNFTKWIINNTTEELPLLFFARDGYVLEKAYHILSSRKNGIYFYGSRRSLIVPSLYKDSSINHLYQMIQSSASQITYSDILKKIGLDTEYVRNYKAIKNIDFEQVLDRNGLKDNQDFLNFYQKIQPLVHDNSKKELSAFYKYCHQLGIENKDLQVVDIGWRCTMQSCLQDLLPGTCITGYYIGVRENALIKDKSQVHGYLLDGEDNFEIRSMLAAMTALIEIFFSAPHGTTIKYYDDGKVELKDESAFVSTKALELAEKLQKGALSFVNDFSNSILSEYIDISASESFSGLKYLGYHSHKKELSLFAPIPFDTGVGYSSTALHSPINEYIIHPRKLVLDFSRSNWKVGFLKNLMKMPFNYEKLFKTIYRKKHG